VEDLAAVIAFGLDHPQISGARDPADGERGLCVRREGALQFAHRFAAADPLAGLRHVGDEVLVAKLVLRVGVQGDSSSARAARISRRCCRVWCASGSSEPVAPVYRD
jgi:hypothetical protein